LSNEEQASRIPIATHSVLRHKTQGRRNEYSAPEFAELIGAANVTQNAKKRDVRWDGRIPSLTGVLALQAVVLRDSQIDTMKPG